MATVTLTYDILKAAQADLRKRYQEYVPKMWVTRKMFEPEFDLVTVSEPIAPNHVATVNLSVIEKGAGYNTAPKWYTKLFNYGVHANGIVERLTTTSWGQMPEGTAYMGAVSEWASALRNPTKKIASTVPVPEVPKQETPAPESPKPAEGWAPVPKHYVPPLDPKIAQLLNQRPTDTYCPKGEKHQYGESRICGYSWHGPVRAADCVNCGYTWSDH